MTKEKKQSPEKELEALRDAIYDLENRLQRVKSHKPEVTVENSLSSEGQQQTIDAFQSVEGEERAVEAMLHALRAREQELVVEVITQTKLPAVQEEIARRFEALEKAQAELERVKEAYDSAEQEWVEANERETGLKSTLHDARKQARELAAQAEATSKRSSAPLVRSMPHLHQVGA
jgi:hypothetical protein